MQDTKFRMKKIKYFFLTSYFLFSQLSAQDNLRFSSDRWLFPNFEINYLRSENESRLDGKLDNLIDFEYNELIGLDGLINIYERFNDVYTNYNFDKGDNFVSVNFSNNDGDSGFLQADSSVISVNTLINKFLDSKDQEGSYKIMAGEQFYDININKIVDNDSLIVYQVPLGYEPLNIKEARVKLKKCENSLDPLEISIDFPWYFSFLNYKLEKKD